MGSYASTLGLTDATQFYRTAPANYYAKFWHDNAVDGKAYGFPYDDDAGQSSYISHANPVPPGSRRLVTQPRWSVVRPLAGPRSVV